MSPLLDGYRSEFPSREPNLSNCESNEELEDLRYDESVRSFPLSPASEIVVGDVPTGSNTGQHKYLWLILPDDMPFAEEQGQLGRSTKRGRLAHTNLSGKLNAHSGGELWFAAGDKLFVTGASSRFRPRTKEELDRIVDCFRAAGYAVTSCGWDEENKVPARFFRGSVE